MPPPEMGLFIAEVANIPPVPMMPAPAMPFRFMDLPVELRVQVYQHLVVVGKVFYTPGAFELEESYLFCDYKRSLQLDLSILRVSKATYEEAGHLYLTANTFVLPHTWTSLPPFHTEKLARRALFADAAIKKIKHIALMLDLRSHEWPLVMCRIDWNALQDDANLSFGQLTPAERLNTAHGEAHFWLSCLRSNMSAKISEFESLQSIDLDVANAYCSFGSCRVFDLDWNEAFKHVKNIRFFIQDPQESIEITETWMQQARLTREELDQRFHVEFVVDDRDEVFTATP